MEKSGKYHAEAAAGAALPADLRFAASEAYKRLRTNLLAALPDGSGCRVVGITSAERGEGKSTTAFYLACALAQTGRRVLLLEADLRMPSISGRLGLQTAPGLSNLLAGQAAAEDVMQQAGGEMPFRLIAAGDAPPNPSELLGSDRMKCLLEELRASFDFILLDLPPVSAVADALVVAGQVTGLILVARQDSSSSRALRGALQQLNFAGANVLGTVLTDAGGGRSGKRTGYDFGYGSGYGF